MSDPAPSGPWDLVVVGGGAAGLAAARAGVADGRRTLLVQDGPPGGDCTFTGCVPSKSLIAAAAAGLAPEVAWARVGAAVATVARSEDRASLRREGVAVLEGRARLAPARTVEVGGRRVAAARIVLATGSRPVLPPVPGLAEAGPLTTDDLWDEPAPPSSLAIVGGGAVGCELAQALARLGARVTLVESEPRLLGREEPDAAAIVTAALVRDGVDVRAGTRVAGVAAGAAGVDLTLEPGPAVRAERVLVAAGRRPASDGLGAEGAGVALGPGGEIVVDGRLATSAEGVYAAGDVTGHPQLTHLADEMGRLAVANAFARRGRALSLAAIPSVVFTDPEVARVGIAEAAAPGRARVAEVAMSQVDRAVTEDRTEGFVRLVAAPRPILGRRWGGRLVGATIVCPRAGELIHEPALAIRSGMFAGRLAQTVHAYPTWSTAIRQAAARLVPRAGGPAARRPRR